jgi:hypothetical protein
MKTVSWWIPGFNKAWSMHQGTFKDAKERAKYICALKSQSRCDPEVTIYGEDKNGNQTSRHLIRL